MSTRRRRYTPSAEVPLADSSSAADNRVAAGEAPVPEPVEGPEELDGTEELIAAAFQSLFDLSFDGRPHWYGPNLEYRYDVAAASGFRLMGDAPFPQTASTPDAAEGDAVRAEATGAFPPGRIARGQPQLAARRLDASLLARLYHACVMAELAVMPYYIARDPADRDRQSRRIAHVVGLDHAVRTGLIQGYVICWPKGRFPKMARSIRLIVPGGRRQRGRELGEMEAPLRAWIEAFKEVPGSE